MVSLCDKTRMTDEYLEVEPNKRFFEVLRAFSDNQHDPIPEWEFQPHIHTVKTDRCICTTRIENNFYIKHKRTGKQLVIGSECVKRWMMPRLLCKGCSSPLGRVCERVRRQDFLCRDCKRFLKRLETEKLKKLGNYKLLWGGKYYGRTFEEVAQDLPYVEFLLNLPVSPRPKTLMAFEEYASLLYEIVETKVT